MLKKLSSNHLVLAISGLVLLYAFYNYSNNKSLIVSGMKGGPGGNSFSAGASNVGANSVSAYVSHGVLSGEALKKINKSKLKEIVTTNTISSLEDESNNKIRRLSIAPLIAEAVKRIDNHSSVSSLFNWGD